MSQQADLVEHSSSKSSPSNELTEGPLVLVIEDEACVRRYLHSALIAENYRCVEAATGQEGLRLALHTPPDLVILDLGLPDWDGQKVLQQLREWLQAPVIVLSARNRERDKVAVLENGADDYVTKPFGMGELLARIRVALRHAARFSRNESSVFRVGDLRVD